MAIELSNLTFTDQDDVVPASGVEEIINTGIANTLAGNDTITSIGTKFRIHPSINILGTGFHNIGTLNTVEGNDRITGIHRPNQFEPYPDDPTGLGNVRSYGIFNERGTIDTGDGNDLITGISEAKEGIGPHSTFYPFGIENYYGIINTGDGNDAIVGTGDIGIYNDFSSTIDTGKGNDLITGIGRVGILNFIATLDTGSGNDIITGIGNDLYGGGGIINFKSINTGEGNDTITGTTRRGSGIENFSNTSIDTGDGDDIITGISTSYGIYNSGGTINTGNGNDSIIADGGSDASWAAWGIYNSGGTINTGNGEDSIISRGALINYGGVFLGEGNDLITADTDLHDRAIENLNAIETGDGDDTITSSGVIYNEGVINTGNGNDYIEGVDIAGLGYGIYNNGGAINTGDGNDSIIANEGFESGPNSSGAWFLGEGEDYIKGFGSGDFYGGNGNDTLELTPGTYTVGIWGEGGESPIFTKGNQLMITSEFEKLKAGGTIYDFTSLTAGQIIVVA
jgi:hypothetical protein